MRRVAVTRCELVPNAKSSTAIATTRTSRRRRTLPKALQAFLDDPNFIFVRPIPPTTKIIGEQNLNRRNHCSA